MSEALNISRKDQIIDVAAKLFKEKGYEATSMRDIASDLNIEAASIYHHFNSKEQLLETICFFMANKYITAIQEVNDIYFNAEEKLKQAIKNHVELIAENLYFSAVFIKEWRSLSEPKLSEFVALRNQYEQGMLQILKQGEEEDVFEPTDKKFASLTILGAVNWMIEWYNPTGSMNANEIAAKLSDFILGGLRKKFVTDPNYKP